MCDNDEFLDGPEKFYNKKTNYIKEKNNAKDKSTTDNG
jgi:hypothetical protein